MDSPECAMNKHISPILGGNTSIGKRNTNLLTMQEIQDLNKCVQNVSVGKNNTAENDFFCDILDCMPDKFHRDLSFVTIKLQQFYCKLCKCSIGDVQNVFNSAIILHNHFCSVSHKIQSVLITITENTKSSVQQPSFVNKKSRNHNSLQPSLVTNRQTNESSSNDVKVKLSSIEKTKGNNNEFEITFEAQEVALDVLSKVPKIKEETKEENVYSNFANVQKKTELNYVHSKVTKTQKKNKLDGILNNDPKVRKETESNCNSSNIPETQKQYQLGNVFSNIPEERNYIWSESTVCNTSKAQSSLMVESLVVDLPSNENKTKLNISTSNYSESLLPSQIDDNFETVSQIEHTIPVLPSITDHLSELPDSLKAHEKFLKSRNGVIFCYLCSVDICVSETNVKNHIAEVSHKIKFLTELKKYLEGNQRLQVKYLVFMNGQLYCSLCKCYFTTRSCFETFGSRVKAHFEKEEVHSLTYKGKSPNHKEKLISRVKKEETHPRSTEEVIIESCIPIGQSKAKQKQPVSVTNELENNVGVSFDNSSKRSMKVNIDSNLDEPKIVADISHNCSKLKQKNLKRKSNKLFKPVEDINEDFQAHSSKNANLVNFEFMNTSPKLAEASIGKEKSFPPYKKVFENTKMDLSLKRLITTAPLVRLNKDFIQKVDVNFHCSLCSEIVSYSPQKYVLSKNFSAHFKSTTHISNLKNKLKKKTKIGKVGVNLQAYKQKCQEFYRLSETDFFNSTENKTSFKATTRNSLKLKCNRRNSKHFKKGKRKRGRVGYYSKKAAYSKLIKKQLYPMLRFMPLDNPHKYVGFERLKMHPLLQKLVCKSPLLLINKQYITRPDINFYCTLCHKSITYSPKKLLLAQYFNEHFKTTAHASLVESNCSGREDRIPSTLESVKCPSESILDQCSCVAKGYRVSPFAKTFIGTRNLLIQSKNEELFFCNHCSKHIRTIPLKSFESSIIQHCSKSHIKKADRRSEGVIGEIISCNDRLKANFEFIKVSCHAAACTLCCKRITFSGNYNLLIYNFLLHFQSENHKLMYRSKICNSSLKRRVSLLGKSKKYNLKPFTADELI